MLQWESYLTAGSSQVSCIFMFIQVTLEYSFEANKLGICEQQPLMIMSVYLIFLWCIAPKSCSCRDINMSSGPGLLREIRMGRNNIVIIQASVIKRINCLPGISGLYWIGWHLTKASIRIFLGHCIQIREPGHLIRIRWLIMITTNLLQRRHFDPFAFSPPIFLLMKFFHLVLNVLVQWAFGCFPFFSWANKVSCIHSSLSTFGSTDLFKRFRVLVISKFSTSISSKSNDSASSLSFSSSAWVCLWIAAEIHCSILSSSMSSDAFIFARSCRAFSASAIFASNAFCFASRSAATSLEEWHDCGETSYLG